MPTYVYAGTPSSLAYQLMVDPYQEVTLGSGGFNLPDEYEPITLQIEENLDDIFIEPSISATYFSMVDLPIGGTWIISGPDNEALYVVKVATKRVDAQAGVTSYTFNTLMTRLAHHEPSGVVISAAEAGLGATATPNEVLSFLIGRWSQEIPGLSLAPPPTLELRGSSGPITPWVLFLSVSQTDDQLSVREWLSKFFEVFEGYSFRMNGGQFTVIPPAYMQTTAIDLNPALVLSQSVSGSSDGVINSQTVRHRPLVKGGVFEKNDNGTPKQPSDLPEIAEPVFYRQGETDHAKLPDNRRQLLNGHVVPYTYSDDLYPIVPPVRVTWTAYVFGTAQRADGSWDTRDFSSSIAIQTHVVDMGPAGAYFDMVTRWHYFDAGDLFRTGGPLSPEAAWVWRVYVTKKGVKAVLVEPTGNIVQEAVMRPDGIFAAPQTWRLGAEFHLNVQGMAWERSNVSYSATYGVYTPPTLPPGVAPPPVEYATDPAVEATKPIYGRKAGNEKVIDIWSLVATEGATGEELSEAEKSENEEAIRALVVQTLMDIAQHAVKERLLPFDEVELTFMRPFPITAQQIGRLASYGERTGVIRSYGLTEAHALTGSETTLRITLRAPVTAERQPITFVPITPPADTPLTPPGYPGGGFTEFPPFVPGEEPTPITAGPGMVQLDLGRRFDLLILESTAATRVRLYRTDAARTADAGRVAGVWPDPAVLPSLIVEGFLDSTNGFKLDLHAVLGFTPEGVVYALIEGAAVTFRRFVPEGTHT